MAPPTFGAPRPSRVAPLNTSLLSTLRLRALDLGDVPVATGGARVHGHDLREAIVALLDGHPEFVPGPLGGDRGQPLPAPGVHHLVIDERQLAHASTPRVGGGRARPH